MPIYEYRCNKCGKVIEVFHKNFRSDESVVCPDCGSEKLKKLISAPARVIVDDRGRGTTCCGRTERCDTPPCETDGRCRRD